MDRHQRKVEKQRKKKLAAKKSAHARLARRPGEEERLLRGALHSPIGRCAISHGWNVDESPPTLVTVVATRKLPTGLLLPAVALIDRTCLGVKNGFVADPIAPLNLSDYLAEVGMAHGGMDGEWDDAQLLAAWDPALDGVPDTAIVRSATTSRDSA